MSEKKAIINQLKWYKDMGVDEVIDASPQNHQKKPTSSAKTDVSSMTKSTTQRTPSSQSATRAKITSPQQSVLKAKELAESCNSLAELRKAIENFDGLSIKKTAQNTVFCDGNPDADVMVIGEAPGADEDTQGIPFCGASGQLLDQMLACIGLERTKNFYITNTVFWRPPGNRRPTPEELATCKPFVEKHIALMSPKLIILVGATAITSVLDNKQAIGKLRGQFFDYSNPYTNTTIPTTALFHPAYLLRSPGQKKVVWQDLLSLQIHMEKEHILAQPSA